MVQNPCAKQETLAQFLGWEDPLERDRLPTPLFLGFPGGSAGKESACNAGDLCLIPGLGRSPGEGHGNRLQYSCPENLPMDKGAWRAIVHGVAKSRTQLSNQAHSTRDSLSVYKISADHAEGLTQDLRATDQFPFAISIGSASRTFSLLSYHKQMKTIAQNKLTVTDIFLLVSSARISKDIS